MPNLISTRQLDLLGLSGYIATNFSGANNNTGTLTGVFYGINNPSGYLTGINSGAFYGSNNPSGFLTGFNSGLYVTQNQTGQFYSVNNPNNYINIFQTGGFYDNNNNSGFIPSSITGQFYSSNNPSGFITGIPGSFTGINSPLIYVSKSQGSDTRGTNSKYSFTAPFATLTAALSVANTGDTIYVQDGVFTDKNMILLNGVNWYFGPASTINVLATTFDDFIFYDGGAAVTGIIAGNNQTFSITNPAGEVFGYNFIGKSNLKFSNIHLNVSSTEPSSNAYAINIGGSARLEHYGNINANIISPNNGYGIYIAGSANVNLYGDIKTNSNAINTDSSFQGRIKVKGEILSSGNAAYVSNTNLGYIAVDTLIDASGFNSAGNIIVKNPQLFIQNIDAPNSFVQSFNYGPQDAILQMSLTGNISTGTIFFPADANTRLGQKLYISNNSNFQISNLGLGLTGGNIYGFSGALNPGTLSFIKGSSNTWSKVH